MCAHSLVSPCRWVLALDSDDAAFGGHARIDKATTFHGQNFSINERPYSIQVSGYCSTTLRGMSSRLPRLSYKCSVNCVACHVP